MKQKKLCFCGGKVRLAEDLVTVEGDYRSLRDWINDDKGYFLIRLDREQGLIEAGFCKEVNVVSVLFRGRKPEDIYFEVGRMGLLGRDDHNAYLGSELRRAHLALKNNLAYVQDEELRLDRPWSAEDEKHGKETREHGTQKES